MLARHQGLEPWPFGLEPKMLNHWHQWRLYFVTPVGFEPTLFRLKVGGLNQLSYEVLLWSRRVTIPFLWFFRPAQWPHLPQLLILGVWPVTIRLSSLSQSDGSTISPSHTIYFCDPGGIRTHGLPIKSRRLGPTQLRSHNLLNTKKPKFNELGSVSFIIFILIKSLSLQKINTILFQYQVLIYC